VVVFKPKFSIKLLGGMVAWLSIFPVGLGFFQLIGGDNSTNPILLVATLVSGSLIVYLTLIYIFGWMQSKAVVDSGILTFYSLGRVGKRDVVNVDLPNLKRIVSHVRQVPWHAGFPVRTWRGFQSVRYLSFYYNDSTYLDLSLNIWDTDTINKLLRHLKTLHPRIELS